MFRKFSIRADAAPWSRHSVRALLSTDRLPRSSTVMAVLRICLGTVYLWFGALKLAGASTVNSLFQATLPRPPPRWLVPPTGPPPPLFPPPLPRPPHPLPSLPP